MGPPEARCEKFEGSDTLDVSRFVDLQRVENLLELEDCPGLSVPLSLVVDRLLRVNPVDHISERPNREEGLQEAVDVASCALIHKPDCCYLIVSEIVHSESASLNL